MALSIFVADGYTAKGKVPEVPGLYPAVWFTYRPASPAVRMRYTEAAGAAEKADAAAQIVAESVGELRVEGDPNSVRITADLFRKKLHAGIGQHILFSVLGFIGPDVGEDEKNSSGPSPTS